MFANKSHNDINGYYCLKNNNNIERIIQGAKKKPFKMFKTVDENAPQCFTTIAWGVHIYTRIEYTV